MGDWGWVTLCVDECDFVSIVAEVVVCRLSDWWFHRQHWSAAAKSWAASEAGWSPSLGTTCHHFITVCCPSIQQLHGEPCCRSFWHCSFMAVFFVIVAHLIVDVKRPCGLRYLAHWTFTDDCKQWCHYSMMSQQDSAVAGSFQQYHHIFTLCSETRENPQIHDPTVVISAPEIFMKLQKICLAKMTLWFFAYYNIFWL